MFIALDLSGADWLNTAHVCKDEAMLEVARSKKSPHPITGARMTGLTIEQVMADHKLIGNKIDPLEIDALRREHLPDILTQARFLPRTMSIRQCAKKANHGLNYREGYKTFALKNEMEEREASKIVELYRKKSYPGLLRWYDELDETIRRTRTLTNCFGRKVYFQGALNDETFRQATAFIPSSTTFDTSAVAMHRFMEDDSLEFSHARMVMQTHDSLTFDYRSEDWPAMAAFTRKMALDYMSPVLDYGEPYTLDVSLKAGMTWGGMKELPINDDLGHALKQLAGKLP